MPTLFRLDKSHTTVLHHPYSTPRPPLNVPYVVDNIWEWARPEAFPSRRSSVYASPSAALARAAGGVAPDKSVFVVDIEDPSQAKIAQIEQPDARYHPDVRDIRRFLIDSLGPDWWGSASRDERAAIAPLWMPVLPREQTESILAHPLLHPHRQKLLDCVKFWRDAHLVSVTQAWPFTDGEVFFQAPSWRMRSLDAEQNG